MGELSGIRFGAVIATAAKAHGLDPTLLAAVAAQESGGPGAISGSNVVGDGGHGHGVFQIDDRYHAFAATPAAMNVAKNADYAATMIQQNLKATGGNVHAALSMYNTGKPNAVGTTTTWSDGSTLGYADSVLRHARDIGSTLAGELRASRDDDATAIGGLAAAAARQLAPAASTTLGTLANAAGLLPGLLNGASSGTESGLESSQNAQSLVSGLTQSVAGTPLSSTSSSSGSTAALSDPGALQIASPVTQNGYSYHSYQSENSAGSGASSDADKNASSIIDSGDDVFNTSPSDQS